jgi:hypothetical protein
MDSHSTGVGLRADPRRDRQPFQTLNPKCGRRPHLKCRLATEATRSRCWLLRSWRGRALNLGAFVEALSLIVAGSWLGSFFPFEQGKPVVRDLADALEAGREIKV